MNLGVEFAIFSLKMSESILKQIIDENNKEISKNDVKNLVNLFEKLATFNNSSSSYAASNNFSGGNYSYQSNANNSYFDYSNSLGNSSSNSLGNSSSNSSGNSSSNTAENFSSTQQSNSPVPPAPDPSAMTENEKNVYDDIQSKYKMSKEQVVQERWRADSETDEYGYGDINDFTSIQDCRDKTTDDVVKSYNDDRKSQADNEFLNSDAGKSYSSRQGQEKQHNEPLKNSESEPTQAKESESSSLLKDNEPKITQAKASELSSPNMSSPPDTPTDKSHQENVASACDNSGMDEKSNAAAPEPMPSPTPTSAPTPSMG